MLSKPYLILFNCVKKNILIWPYHFVYQPDKLMDTRDGLDSRLLERKNWIYLFDFEGTYAIYVIGTN
jgi:hypothetical protein